MADRTEWVMTTQESKQWVRTLIKNIEPLKAQLQEFLTSRKQRIGPKTFSSGMTSLLYRACGASSDTTEFVEYLIQLYVKDHDINQVFTYNPRSSPSNKSISDKLAAVKTTFVHGAVEGSRFHSLPILKILVKHGAMLNGKNCCGKVPLMLAIENQQHSVISFLLDSGVELNCSDKDGLTPLMHLSSDPQLEMVKFIPQMIKRGADVLRRDNRGYTALHIAVYEENHVAVQELLKFLPKFLENGTELLPTDMPHPSVTFKCNSKVYFAINERMQRILSYFNEHLEQLSKQHQVDVILVDGVFHLHDFLLSSRREKALTFFEHKIAEALLLKKKLAIPNETATEECQTYDDFKTNVIDSNKLKAKVKYSLNLSISILQRCIGRDSRTLFDFLKTVYIWLLANEEYEYGLTVLEQMSDILTQSCSPSHPSVGYLQEMTQNLMDKIHTMFKSSLSITAMQQSYSEYKLIDVGLLSRHMNPVFYNIMVTICFCTEHTKHIHSHKIPNKSTSILFASFIEHLVPFVKGSMTFELDYERIIAGLVEKCPRVIIDVNGNATTLLHITLSTFRSNGPKIVKSILENGGDYLINDVGPCGNRPVQSISDESMIYTLIDHGAHLDAVNMFGQKVYHSITLFVSKPPSFPLRLSCLCCAVVVESVPYLSMDLPNRVKNQLLLHDKRAEQVLLEEELGFN